MTNIIIKMIKIYNILEIIFEIIKFIKIFNKYIIDKYNFLIRKQVITSCKSKLFRIRKHILYIILLLIDFFDSSLTFHAL